MSEAEGSGLESSKRPSGLRKRIWNSIIHRGSPRHGIEREGSRTRRRSLEDSSVGNLSAPKEATKARRSKSFRERTSRALHALVGRRRVHSSDTHDQEELSSAVVSAEHEPISVRGEHADLSPASSHTVTSERSQTVPVVTVETVSHSSSRNNSIACSLSPGGSPLPRPRLHTKEKYANFTKWLKGGKPGKDLCFWSPSPEVDFDWVSLSGRTLTLVDEDCLALSEAERRALQKVALKQLTAFYAQGVQVASIPKADGRPRGMKHAISLRSRGKLLGLENDGSPLEGCVFNLPLKCVIKNDRELIKKPALPPSRPASVASSSDSLGESDQYSLNEGTVVDDESHNEDVPTNPTPTTFAMASDLNGSRSSLDNIFQVGTYSSSLSPAYYENEHSGMVRSMSFNVTEDFLAPRPSRSGRSSPMHANSPDLMASSDDILPRSDAGSSRTQLVEALSLPMAAGASPRRRPVPNTKRDLQVEINELVAPPKRHVPVLVCEAINFLKSHGLHTVGLFRVAGAKKRWKKIQTQFDNGFEILFDPDLHVPSDVASLLKVFFRDLPEPLLTRDLYPAFMAAARIDTRVIKLEVLRLLCCLLPLANRDTLYTLLSFLNQVAMHSAEVCSLCNLPGNKMDHANLAVVIGPNILRAHKGKTGDDYKVSRQGEVEQQEDLKHVVALLIEHYQFIFTIPRELQHEALLALKGKHPEVLNCLLKQKCVHRGLESSLETTFRRREIDCQSLDDLLLETLHRHRRTALPDLDATQRFRSGTVTLGDLERHPITGKLVPSFAVGGGALLGRAASPLSRGLGMAKKEAANSARTLLSLATEEVAASSDGAPIYRRRLYSLPHVLDYSHSNDTASIKVNNQQTSSAQAPAPESNGVEVHHSNHRQVNNQQRGGGLEEKRSSPAVKRSPRRGDLGSSSLRNSFRKLRQKLSLNASDRPNALPLQTASCDITPTGSGASTPKAIPQDSSSGDRTPQLDLRSGTGLTPVNSGRRLFISQDSNVDKTLPELAQNIRAAMEAVRSSQTDGDSIKEVRSPPFASTPKRPIVKQHSAPLLSLDDDRSDGSNQARRGSEIERLRQFFESLSNPRSDQKVVSKGSRQVTAYTSGQFVSVSLPNGQREYLDSPESAGSPDSLFSDSLSDKAETVV